jgi:hypothetical protein
MRDLECRYGEHYEDDLDLLWANTKAHLRGDEAHHTLLVRARVHKGYNFLAGGRRDGVGENNAREAVGANVVGLVVSGSMGGRRDGIVNLWERTW